MSVHDKGSLRGRLNHFYHCNVILLDIITGQQRVNSDDRMIVILCERNKKMQDAVQWPVVYARIVDIVIVIIVVMPAALCHARDC